MPVFKWLKKEFINKIMVIMVINFFLDVQYLSPHKFKFAVKIKCIQSNKFFWQLDNVPRSVFRYNAGLRTPSGVFIKDMYSLSSI